MKLIYILTFICLHFILPVQSQEYSEFQFESLHAKLITILRLPYWQSREFRAPEDLPHNRVRDIAEGQDGNIWMATWGGGVVCKDGIHTTVYTIQNGLLSNSTRELAVDHIGGVWVCTNRGMNYIHPNGTVYAYNQSNITGSRNDNYLSVVIDKNGTVWCGAYDFQLVTIKRDHNNPELPYQKKGALVGLSNYGFNQQTNGGVEELVFDIEDNLWLGVNGFGIIRISALNSITVWDTFEQYDPNGYQIYALKAHQTRGIYAGIGRQIYHIFDNEVHEVINKGLTTTFAIEYFQDHLLLGTISGIYIDNLKNIPITEINHISLNQEDTNFYIQCITLMSDGSIWIGTKSGVFRYSQSIWKKELFVNDVYPSMTVYHAKNYNGNVLHLVRDTARDKPYSMFLYDNQFNNLGDFEYLTKQQVNNEELDDENTEVFYGLIHYITNQDNTGFDSGINGVYKIYRSDPPQIIKLPHVPKYDHYSARNHKLYHPTRDELWILYAQGAYRWDGNEWVAQPPLIKREKLYVTSMLKTEEHEYWFGGEGWIEIWRNGEGKIVELPESFYTNPVRITSMIEHEGKIWIGTWGNGILIYDQGNWSHMTYDDGVPYEDIVEMYSASDGTLWVSMESGGIMSLKDNRWISYGTGDGVSLDTVIFFHEDKQGSIVASDYLIRYYYNPDRLPPSIQLDNYPQTLYPNEKGTFSFTATDAWYETPRDELVYSWRITNQDDYTITSDWSRYSNQTIITTKRMQPGRYRFEVKVQDKSRNTSPQPAVVGFTVAPYFWSTPEFIIPVSISILIAAISLLIWYRNYRKLHQSEERYRYLLDKDAVTLVLNWNERGQLIYSNETAQLFFHEIDKTFREKAIHEWLCPPGFEGYVDWQNTLQKSQTNLESRNYCLIPLQQCGKKHWISWFIRCHQKNSTSPIEYHAVGVDVTDQVNVERALMQEKMSFQEFCDRAQVGIIRVDQQQRVIYMNPAMKKLIQTDNNELPQWDQWTDESSWKSLIWMIRNQKGTAIETVTGHTIKTHDTFFALVSGMEKEDCIELMILDFTEQKKLQEKLSLMSQYEQEKLGRELHDGLGQMLTASVYLCSL